MSVCQTAFLFIFRIYLACFSITIPVINGVVVHEVICFPPTILLCLHDSITATIACNMDLTKYPMDRQVCTLQLESCEYL